MSMLLKTMVTRILVLLLVLCEGAVTYASEPRCSEFNYLESLLEKLVRLEHRLEQQEQVVQQHEMKLQSEKNPLVAFTAYRDKSISLSVGDVVKFDNLLINQGDHYSPSTGKFTAPYDGIFFFTWHTQSKLSLTTCLSVNGVCQLHAYATGKPTKNDILPDGNSATLRLTKGDKVWIEILNGSQLYSNSDNKWYYPAFTGYSLQ